MKKTVLLLAIALCFSVAANAQGSFGVKAGLNFNKLSDISKSVKASWNAQTGFHAGLAYQYKMPFGLSFQPELLYSRTRTRFEGEVSSHSYFDLSLDYLTLPVNVQFGFNILFLRPFVFAAPYISYSLAANGSLFDDDQWKDRNRFDYGLGLGIGLEIWKLQITGKYNWGFGNPLNGISSKDWKIDDSHVKGFELSAAFLF